MAITDPFATAVLALTETLRAAINDPADQIRLLINLAQFNSTAAVNSPYAAASAATASLCRRAALTSLANATATYQPTSSNDALAILATVVPLYDAEILYSADMGDIDSYQTLRDLRSAIVTDLQQRVITLPALITITTAIPLPSLVNAWKLYADATREGDLVNRNPSVIHPAFMPNTFEALSS